ncbi:hypothetical protein [Lacipirellula sp.]|uniref:hypothetical protein n=1 Tax=Lacipirellula sp. TaxID=2691419 RepID=UPI003D0E18EF
MLSGWRSKRLESFVVSFAHFAKLPSPKEIMQQIESHWHDSENYRRVDYSARYTRHRSGVEVTLLKPKQVTFFCPATKAELRTIGVRTERGCELLVDQLHASGHLRDLELRIELGLAV